MAVSEWNGSKPKWQTAAGWTPETVPTSIIDALFTATHVGNCAVEAALRKCQSLVMTGYTGTFTIGELEVGGATEQSEHIALKLAGTLAGGGTLFLAHSVGVVQTIDTGGKTIPWKVQQTGTAKYKLLSNLTVFNATSRNYLLEAGELQANGNTIEVQNGSFSVSGAASLDLSSSKLIGLGELLGFNWGSSGTLTTNSATIIEIGNVSFPSSQFGGGGKTYKGTVKWIGRECRVDSILGQTFSEGVLEILNKGASEKGIQTKAGATTTILSSSTLAFNGTEAEPNRIESSKAEEAHKWVIPAGGIETLARIVAIDQDFSGGGKLYAPNAVTITRSPNVVKEAKPAAGVSVSASAGAGVSAVVKRTAQAAPSSTSHLRVSAQVTRLARAGAAVSSGATVSVGALVKSEHGPQSPKLASGVVVSAAVARQAGAAGAAVAGAMVRAEVRRIAQASARASAGVSVAASARRVAQAAPRVSGGAVVTATVRRLARVSALVTVAPTVSAAAHGRQPVLARVSGGVSIRVNVTRIGQSEEPPTSTPIAGHVAIGQRGRIGVHRGRIPTGNIGRAER